MNKHESERTSSRINLPPIEGRNAHQRTLRLLCCGIEDEYAIHMFRDALTANGSDVDVVLTHSTDSEEIARYKSWFAPDFIVFGQPVADSRPQLLRTRMPTQRATNPMAGRHNEDRALTTRQMEVLEYLKNGCTNKQIAGYMNVQPRTVKEWLKELYIMFFVCNRTELVARACEHPHELDGPA